jgi:hypothetical protein
LVKKKRYVDRKQDIFFSRGQYIYKARARGARGRNQKAVAQNRVI